MEKKATMDDIFKKGNKFEFKQIDYSTKKMSRQIDRVKKEQEKIKKSTEIDWNDPTLYEPLI